ncbi:MAG TPA: hypothetical protein VK939_07105 [Longimicrobiales bacterium]|nr:hypothetical protein [Longimicrobiales bacterium]
MKNRTPLLLAAVMALALVACGDDSGTGPVPTTSAVLLLRNDANVPITMVHVASCSVDSWGSNRLGSGESIAPGAVRSWTFAPDCYDVRASTGAKFGTWWDQQMASGDTVRLALPASAGSDEALVMEPAKLR